MNSKDDSEKIYSGRPTKQFPTKYTGFRKNLKRLRIRDKYGGSAPGGFINQDRAKSIDYIDVPSFDLRVTYEYSSAGGSLLRPEVTETIIVEISGSSSDRERFKKAIGLEDLADTN